jgi:hypothetical protein
MRIPQKKWNLNKALRLPFASAPRKKHRAWRCAQRKTKKKNITHKST